MMHTTLWRRCLSGIVPTPSLRGALLSAEARLRAKADATTASAEARKRRRKQSSLPSRPLDCFASLAMTGRVCALTKSSRCIGRTRPRIAKRLHRRGDGAADGVAVVVGGHLELFVAVDDR